MKTLILIAAALAVLTLSACASEGPASIREGNEAFEAERYEQAREAYDRALEAMPESPEVTYNSANTLYRQELFGEARYKLDVSAETAEPILSQYAAFNAGNSLYMSEEYEAAVEAYKQALRLDPTDQEAKHNLELALQRIEEQEQEGEQEGEQEQEQEGNQEQEDGEGNAPGQRPEPQPEDQEEPQDQEDQNSEEDGEPSEETEPEESESNSTQSPSDPGEVPPTGMTEEQAEQLLEAIADNTDTLRGRMLDNTLFQGSIPEQQW